MKKNEVVKDLVVKGLQPYKVGDLLQPNLSEFNGVDRIYNCIIVFNKCL